MIKTVAPALKALIENVIDYAGFYPPAALPLSEAVANYRDYKGAEFAWMLRWFVVGGQNIDAIPEALDGCLSILAATDSPRAATLETTTVINADHPVYCEVPLSNLELLDEVKRSSNFAKIRTGGLKPEAIPSPADVAAFILACAERRLAFKATAGLHHPIRAEYALTYEKDAPRAVMHGFLNVLMASAFAWHGDTDIESILCESDASAFHFDERASWRDRSLSLEQVKDSRRNFMHSIGSCSFEEPVQELQALGLL